ncbi:hypothetical protein [Massilia sp. HP4]|uniref:hypothetical protein n=1 Tax=Massilia sp. HP4 TaxID=2562316 RepID=UPI0010BFB679|nr:hypothetical protein [Massilia sp. HP4]
MSAIAVLLSMQDGTTSTTATRIAFTAFTLTSEKPAPHRGFEIGESEMMLLEPISRIIDRGYVFYIFRNGVRKPRCGDRKPSSALNEL